MAVIQSLGDIWSLVPSRLRRAYPSVMPIIEFISYGLLCSGGAPGESSLNGHYLMFPVCTRLQVPVCVHAT